MINITETAVNKFKDLMAKKNLTNHMLRLSLKGGGCSGFSYGIDFVDTSATTDKVWEVHGLKVVVDPKSYLYLSGTEVNYVDDIHESGFKFNNPNSKGSCGCGKSVTF